MKITRFCVQKLDIDPNVTYNIKVKVENKEGRAEEIVNVLTGKLPTGVITITDPVWAGDGTASVTINTEETSLTLQYQIGGIEEGKWTETTRGSTISGLKLGQTLYARLFDGTNGTEQASVTVTDTVEPVVTVTPGGTTTNSVTVSANAVDNESGMIASQTYTYYIKKTSEEDTAYVAKATDVVDASYTFTGLTQETSYDVKVEVKADNAGHAGSGVLTGQVTTKIPGGESGVEQGAITFGTPTWSSGTASVTVSTNTEMQIEYQVGAVTEGNWQTISNGGTISNLQHGQTVYARLTDGNNHGDYASVDIKDTELPIVSEITTGEITDTSIAVTVNATDKESGLATEGTYKYYLNGAEQKTDTANSYTFTGLTAETEYTIKVEAFDKAGNKGENSITVSTEKKPIVDAGEIEKNPSAYYGSEVRGYTCASKGVSKWRIFYADSTNIYLIADDYISYRYAPNGQNGTAVSNSGGYSLSFDNVYNDYPGASWINNNSKGKKWLNQFLGSFSSRTNTNIRAVAYMMDTNVWSVYEGEDAEYAMGGPTLELFCASYKDTHPSKYIECRVTSAYGYQVKWSADSGYGYSINGVPQNEFNKIYIKSDTSNTNAMWLASPSANDTNYVMYVGSSGRVGNYGYDTYGPGLRPLVCLKSGVQLNKVSDGVYEIVK